LELEIEKQTNEIKIFDKQIKLIEEENKKLERTVSEN